MRSPELRISPCQRRCTWLPTDEHIDDRQVFACASCGSEWTHEQPWTPVNIDGTMPAEIVRERSDHPAPGHL